MKKNIYIIRHGETEYNRLQIMQGRSIDMSLNETGTTQANAFHEQYKSIPFELVYTSELKRSRESVKNFITATTHVIDDRITEISWGANEGKPIDNKVTQRFKRMMQEWSNGNLEHSIPGGESGKSLRDRLQSFIKDLSTRKEKHILVCTHGRALKMLITLLLNEDISEMEKYKHANTGLYLMEYSDNQFKLKKANDTSHLKSTL